VTRSTAVLLDIDGTLVDSNYFHAIAWFRSFRRHGHDILISDIHRLIGMGADQMLERLPGDEDESMEEAWQEEFAKLRDEIVPTPGARDLVRTLKERGATTVYATSGQPQDVEALRAVIGADEWIDEVVSSEEVDASKPAPDIFQLALERVSVDAGDALVIGDTVWDIEAADACGVPCVAVTTGGISEDELKAAGAVAVYASPADLLAGIDRSPISRLLRPSR
jgi:HAD superfamily hydrolase (TIGR01549 family)